ncbi:MAG: retron Ec67 family RNA-directed DNA polymerase/endonuclease [Lachnospiraceae bacterium]|nr:retron Ec67 family RNA-directed DNA polymerase/endonuclease [Lachnospiraceae bacterium]
MLKFNEISYRDELAEFLNIPLKKLTYILYVKKVDSYYTSFQIPKKNGDYRSIDAPYGDLKYIQKILAIKLWEYHNKYTSDNNINMKVSHAFEKKKSIITNAIIHKNKRFILNIDLSDFFASFHFGRVRGFFEKNKEFNLPIEVATIIAQLTCYKGHLPQGAPSSPIISNLICNILDMRLLGISQKYKLDYTRYAEDMTVSTNDFKFIYLVDDFMKEITKEIEKSGFSINNKKTRFVFNDSRQEVTGLVVNKKISVNRDYCKKTRAMADSLYRKGEYVINGSKGTIQQLEGRFAFINQIDRFNNNFNYVKHKIWDFNSREKQYQKFLFYKYFYANTKPLIVTEGKTDILYIKAALKKYYYKYPELIFKKDEDYIFNISFLKRSSFLEYFLNIYQDGADDIKNIYNFYVGNNHYPNLYEFFLEKSSLKPKNPVILIFDNEQNSDRPLKKFLNHIKIDSKNFKSGQCIYANIYLITNPLVKGKAECEIEDLFEETILENVIEDKKFSREKKYDINKFYGKDIFSKYINDNYKTINFDGFIPILDDINKVVTNMDF